jgi:hypothetical protein
MQGKTSKRFRRIWGDYLSAPVVIVGITLSVADGWLIVDRDKVVVGIKVIQGRIELGGHLK